MIVFPRRVDEALEAALASGGEYRAGGTDLQDRRHHLPVAQRLPLVDLRDIAGLDAITCDHQGATIGALTTLANIAAHPLLSERWPGITQACGALANPQIRAVATLAGNLLQGPRCWYYRHPDYACLRKGGATCFAREGDHLWHVCFDHSACAAPHPSTAALALLAYDAEVELLDPTHDQPVRVPISAVLDHEDPPPSHALITAVHLGPPLHAEQTAYVRASNRAFAEWALVEVSVRLRVGSGGEIAFVRVTAGGVASTPLRLDAVEQALLGGPADAQAFASAAQLAHTGAKPLPMTDYKLGLLGASVYEALSGALAASPTPAAITF